jgi:hypothetical protein
MIDQTSASVRRNVMPETYRAMTCSFAARAMQCRQRRVRSSARAAAGQEKDAGDKGARATDLDDVFQVNGTDVRRASLRWLTVFLFLVTFAHAALADYQTSQADENPSYWDDFTAKARPQPSVVWRKIENGHSDSVGTGSTPPAIRSCSAARQRVAVSQGCSWSIWLAWRSHNPRDPPGEVLQSVE